MSGEQEETHDKFDTNGDVPRVQGPGGRSSDPVLKKSTSMYLNVVAPHKPGRPSIDHTSEGALTQEFTLYGDESYVPSERVQEVINNVHDHKHRAQKIFSEMDVLRNRNENDFEWREVCRWVKYEEKLEESSNRWSKPHVASLSMHYIVELRRLLMEGKLLLDVECYSVSQIVEKFLDEWIAGHQLDPKLRQHLRTVLLKHHRHGEDTRKEKKYKRTMSSQNMLLKVASQASISSSPSAGSLESMESDSVEASKKQNDRFLRKIPKGSEVASIWIGAIEELENPICGFMRLNDPRLLGDLSEVNLPTRFIFILLGPPAMIDNYTECGRCIATMMVDDIFREVAFKCRNKNDLIAGCDEFLEQVTVLPPGEWDPKIRIEPPDSVPDQKIRRTQSSADFFLEATDGKHGGEHDDSHIDPDLVISCRPFKGLFLDIKRKIPFYPSDFKDAIHIQCIASIIYIFLATLTPNVTFGGMLGKATDQYMGVMECIFAAAVTGVAFALMSGQPMNILGSTGPMLVLEKIIFDICKDNNWDFLPTRLWIGVWTTGYLLLIVAFDLSALVKYITRFTEESFACLIALIFIYEAFVKLAEIHYEEAPLNLHPNGTYIPPFHCECIVANQSTTPGALTSMMSTVATTFTSNNNVTSEMMTTTMEMMMSTKHWDKQMCENALNTWHCTGTVPDAFVFSLLLFFGTFGISVFCVQFKTWPCFPTFVRQMISDFGVLIAIILMVGFDYGLGLHTPKLKVPAEFKPTRSDVRGWLIHPFSEKNPWWLYIAAGVPAIIATILIFMDQQITAVIVNRKENKLKKGKGYHLDLLVVAALVLAHSFLGLPWYVAATVSAIAHIQSLKKESECTAPGERPTFLGVREQRVTGLVVGILSGVAVLITNVLGVIPMPVLYGIFFYMGFSALFGMQFIDRILLFLMPVKYQPDYVYLRHVPLWRVHVFTVLQIVCLVALWIVKSIKSISIAFPLLVVFTGVVRKLLECFFTQYELKYLDDILPSMKRKKALKNDDTKPIKNEFSNSAYSGEDNVVSVVDEKKSVSFVDGSQELFVINNPISDINI
ncbi:sodium bicarbonate cotransporter 3-like isoform X2 [Gigantopelta aegis]|uniref:sodium bicarbonate cotransporter 3-like isoform X2 n=1 Tax=Gigantopelta aegis TaxID=1735272 RepID=UPI001B888C34|nr:sodium bicarbonate cotransporter 3-like isoform X2 [Gigantopelta aegis]